MTKRPEISDREGVLLVASLILRLTGKAYKADVVRQALLSTNPDEAAALTEAGLLDTMVEAMAGFSEGVLVAMADMLEGLSKADDAKYLEVATKVRDQMKTEQAA